jgi:4-methyl-5(b-hydroxyethyl)-thiazole monophosphate biosynthesis
MASVLIPLAEGCEELEAVTLIDLLRRAGMAVTTASLGELTVNCAHGTVLLADQTLDTVMNQGFDLIVLPGGLPGADNLNADPRIHQIINRLATGGKYIAAICAAPKVLVSNGVLNGRKLTAYPGALAAINTQAVHITGNPVEIDGNILTSRGPGTAMDFALQLIETLLGKAARDKVEVPLQRP